MKLQILRPFASILERVFRYYMFYGGRGSGKSHNIATALIMLASHFKLRILCTREIQNTIKDSVHKLLSDIIRDHDLDEMLLIKNDSIINTITGSEFIFKGLRMNPLEIKSMEGIDICWCFIAGTKIDKRNIEDIKIGDEVNSFNHKTGKIENKKVIGIMRRKAPNIFYKLLTHNGLYSIIGTKEHPIFVKGKGYISLSDVKEGDIIYACEIKSTSRSPLFGWFRSWLVEGAHNSDRPLQERKRVTKQLQSGYCKYLLWDSHRSRWKLSLWSYIKSRGQKKNGLLAEQRVESIKIQKPDNIKKLGLSDEGNFVYNLEVEDNNNYFANGLLVHNCEEAQSISKTSFDILIPTIRKEGSIIIASFNRKLEKDPVWEIFCENPDANTFMKSGTVLENPFASQTLLNEMEKCKMRSHDDYAHIWHGEPERKKSGRVIKKEWFKYYTVLPAIEYKFIVVDTAQKTKEHNDFTVFQCWGYYQGGIYLIDQYRDKLEAQELRKVAINFWRKHFIVDSQNRAQLRKMYVEDKISGTGLIQEIKANKEVTIPIEGIQRYKDKYTRVLDIVGYLEAERVHLSKDASYLHDFLTECESFNAAMTHKHDDIVDCLCLAKGTKIATLFGDKKIENIKTNDLILTPYGINKVLFLKNNGIKKVIINNNLVATPDHKIFNLDRFCDFDIMDYEKTDKLSFRGLLKWRYKKLLNSMEGLIDSWEGREGIIYLNRKQIKAESVLKDFMSQYGNFITKKEFLKVLLFITKMGIILITISLIWNVYLVSNILRSIGKTLINIFKVKNLVKTLKKLLKQLKNGIKAMKAKNGMENIAKIFGIMFQIINTPAFFAKKYLKLERNNVNIAQVIVNGKQQEEKMLKEVYDIGVEKAGVLYANKILVSNCDAICLVFISKEDTYASKIMDIPSVDKISLWK